MAAKRKQRQPNEDLEAAVAEILDNPIVKINLGFLNVGNAGSEDPSPLNGGDLEPSGYDIRPIGLDAIVAAGGAAFERLDPAPFVVPERSSAMGVELKPMGVESLARAAASGQNMFLAEQLGTLFPAARVHRIRLAQDALSHVEEKVYDLLWGAKNQNRDAYRLSEFSLQRIANEGRLNIKTVRELLPRLVEKGFIAIEREADVRKNRPTQYRVWSYSEVLANQRRRNRFWFVKTGKGVFYASPVSVGVTHDDRPLQELKPMGVEQDTVGVSSKPMGVGDMSILLAELSRSVRSGLGITPDERLLKSMVEECRHKAGLTDGELASDEEILQITEMKLRVLRRASSLRNPLAVLRKAVPECFVGQPLVEHRAAERARKGRELEELRQYESFVSEEPEDDVMRLSCWERVSSRHKTVQGYDLRAIADDPELDEQGRAVALDRIKRLGRFAPRGL